MSGNFTAEMRDFRAHIISVVRNPQQRATKCPPVEATGGRSDSMGACSVQRGEGGGLLTDQGHFDPTILLTPGRNLVVRYRLRLSMPDRGYPIGGDTHSHQRGAHRLGACLGQLLIIGIGAL